MSEKTMIQKYAPKSALQKEVEDRIKKAIDTVERNAEGLDDFNRRIYCQKSLEEIVVYAVVSGDINLAIHLIKIFAKKYGTDSASAKRLVSAVEIRSIINRFKEVDGPFQFIEGQGWRGEEFGGEVVEYSEHAMRVLLKKFLSEFGLPHYSNKLKGILEELSTDSDVFVPVTADQDGTVDMFVKRICYVHPEVECGWEHLYVEYKTFVSGKMLKPLNITKFWDTLKKIQPDIQVTKDRKRFGGKDDHLVKGIAKEPEGISWKQLLGHKD